MTDYPALYARLAQEILKHEALLEADARAFSAKLAETLRQEGWQLGSESESVIDGYVKNARAVVRQGIAVSVAAATGQSLQSKAVLEASEAAFTLRWPDGLKLSDRLWRWDAGTKTGVQQVLQAGIRQGKAVGTVMTDMQRSIERGSGGQRFKIVQEHADDWVTQLHESAQALIHDPAAKAQWKKTMGLAREHIDELKTSGSRHAAERVYDQIQKAVAAGREDLLDKAVKWWTYDRQLYDLKRIARTEMATAAHRAVISSTIHDESIIGYQWRLSASHPRTDICDYYANIDMGLGAGVFTPDEVPRFKAHPHCMCLLIPRVTAIEKKGSTNYVDFVRNSPPGRKAKLLPVWAQEAIKNGTPIDDLIKPNGFGLISKTQFDGKP